MTLGERIKKIRSERKISQKELGRKIGVSQQQIAQYESGKRNPKIENLYRIAVALEVPILELSDNFSEFPEVQAKIYGSTIHSLITLIEDGPCCISDKNASDLLKKLKKCILESQKIKGEDNLHAFFEESEIRFSQEFLCDILEDYKNRSVYEIVCLLSYYLSLSDNARNKVTEYLFDLYEIPIYRSN